MHKSSFSTAIPARADVSVTVSKSSQQMAVSVDGVQVMSVPVPTTTFADHTVARAVPAGSHTIAVAFTNDYGSGCDRNLRVDSVELVP